MRAPKLAVMWGLALALAGPAFAEGFVAPKAGLALPLAMRGLEPHERLTWDIGVEWGGLSDAGIGFGGSFDVVWQRSFQPTRFDTLVSTSGGMIEAFDIDREIKRTMFPLSAFVYVDPMYRFVVHPAAEAGFGPAMLIYINREFDETTGETELTEHSGVYWGWVAKAGFDAHLSLGGDVSVFGGFEYQWSRLTKRKWGTLTRYRMDMSGPAFRVGIRFL